MCSYMMNRNTYLSIINIKCENVLCTVRSTIGHSLCVPSYVCSSGDSLLSIPQGSTKTTILISSHNFDVLLLLSPENGSRISIMAYDKYFRNLTLL